MLPEPDQGDDVDGFASFSLQFAAFVLRRGQRECDVLVPRCLLWHGWLPVLSGVNGATPWSAASEGAGCLVEVALGQYSSRLVAEWNPSDEFDAVQAASSMPDHPTVWTDGSLVLDRVTGVSSSGAGFLLTSLTTAGVDVVGTMWMVFVQMMMVRHVGASFQFLGLSSLFRELKCDQNILALQSSHAVHVGVDNLGWFVMLVDCLMVLMVLLHLSLSMTVTFSGFFIGCFIFGVWTRFGLLRLRGMLMTLWSLMAGFRRMIGRDVICLGFVVVGILLFLIFIGSSLPFLVLLSTMMVMSLGHLVFGIRNGLMYLHLLFVLRTLLSGLLV